MNENLLMLVPPAIAWVLMMGWLFNFRKKKEGMPIVNSILTLFGGRNLIFAILSYGVLLVIWALFLSLFNWLR